MAGTAVRSFVTSAFSMGGTYGSTSCGALWIRRPSRCALSERQPAPRRGQKQLSRKSTGSQTFKRVEHAYKALSAP